MRVYLPYGLDPAISDPIIGGRSPDGRWKCLAYLTLTDGNKFIVHRIELLPWGPVALPLGTKELRRLPLSRWLAGAHAKLGGAAKNHLVSGKPTTHKAGLQRLIDSEVPRSGMQGFGMEFYRRVASDYLELQGSRGIHERIADRMSERDGQTCSLTRIRDYISKATQMGFLSPGTPGVGARLPGPNLYVGKRGD
jgi:hypothetical protein